MARGGLRGHDSRVVFSFLARHPFVSAMRGATARQAAVGVAIALVVTAAFASYRLATREELHPPGEWLTEADQEALWAALSLTGDGPGWRAGCVWEGSARDVREVVDVPRRTRSYEVTGGSARAITLAFAAGEPSSGDYEAEEGSGHFCYVSATIGGR